MNKKVWRLATVWVGLALVVPAWAGNAGPSDLQRSSSHDESECEAHQNRAVVETLPLPNGFNPEGITNGAGSTVFVSSIASGAVYEANLRTGGGRVIVPATEGRAAIGLKWDRRSQLLYVAGGPTGKVFIYDSHTGADVAELVATMEAATFVNDAVVTPDAVYFTDSYRPVIYRLSLLAGGQLPASPTLEEVPLSGDFEFVEGDFNLNGIVSSPDGSSLFVVSSVLGTIYRVDPTTGFSTALDLGGTALTNGDGLLLSGRHLFVVQNFDNQIVDVRLNRHLTAGRVARVLTSDAFDVPTTIARFGNALYAVNARFTTEVTADTEYDVVRVPLRRD